MEPWDQAKTEDPKLTMTASIVKPLMLLFFKFLVSFLPKFPLFFVVSSFQIKQNCRSVWLFWWGLWFRTQYRHSFSFLSMPIIPKKVPLWNSVAIWRYQLSKQINQKNHSMIIWNAYFWCFFCPKCTDFSGMTLLSALDFIQPTSRAMWYRLYHINYKAKIW